MPEEQDLSLAFPDVSETLRKIRARTPARLLVGRAGASYRTATQLDLREAHAAARDAVRGELHLAAVFDAAFVQHRNLQELSTQAHNKNEYLLRPDLGRHFDEQSRLTFQRRCSPGADFLVAIGDGLSVKAVSAQVPSLLPLLLNGAVQRQWSTSGAIPVIHHCRVGILNEIGELLNPTVAVLLIGERPGLATAESLSAYMAYCPRGNHTDANRNVISNIHAQGLSPVQAADRILTLAVLMRNTSISGYLLKQQSRELRDG
jgi:ethanolamine ammonia-lyase small subunit